MKGKSTCKCGKKGYSASGIYRHVRAQEKMQPSAHELLHRLTESYTAIQFYSSDEQSDDILKL